MKINKIDKFIVKSKERFGDKYDFPYIYDEYENSHSKITFTCKDCGHSFTKIACDHITSKIGGCHKCSVDSKRTYYSYEELKNMTNYIIKPFDGKKYKDEIITLICEKHGEYNVHIATLLDGRGMCKICAFTQIDEKKEQEKKDFAIKFITERYSKKFDINFDEYVNYTTPITFKCKDCGNIIKRTPSSCINDKYKDCKVCKDKENAKLKTKTTEQYIQNAIFVHGDKYDYTKTIYISSNEKVEIICKECKRSFWIEANSHLQGHGCPYHFTNKSKDETEIVEYIKEIYQGEILINCRNILNDNKELDIYLPDVGLAFEYNGIFWHNEINKPKNYHLDKTNECKKKNIHLIHIFEDEWKNPIKKEIWKSMIKNQLHLNINKIYARKCEIKIIDNKTARDFLDVNHLQGKCPISINLGLYYNNELISLMSFGKSRHFIGNGKTEYELLRFCNKINTNVIGSASRLFKYFIEKYKPQEIVSYADKRWSKGELYDILGFEKYNESKPNYYYVIKAERKNRFNYRKSILVKKYNCPENMSEHEFCLSQKWYRIYDCGCLCYKWIQK